MAWVAVGTAAVGAVGSYMNSKNQPKAGAPVQAPLAKAPGGVVGPGGGGMMVDPVTGRTVFTSGQGSSGGNVLDQMRNRMMMDKIMGGGDSVGMDLKSKLAEAQARLTRAQTGSGAAKGPSAKDYGLENYIGEDGKLIDISDTNAISQGRNTSAQAQALNKAFQESTGGKYGSNNRDVSFGKWVRDHFQRDVNPKFEKYQNDLKTAGGNAEMSGEEAAAAQRQIDELMGLQSEVDGMRSGIEGNPLMQALNNQTGRYRDRGGAAAGPGGVVPPGGGPDRGDGQAGSEIPGMQNYDVAFNDPRKKKMGDLANDRLDKSGQDAAWLSQLDPNWVNGGGSSDLESMIKAGTTGGAGGQKITAPGFDGGGLGAFRNYLRTGANNQFETQSAIDRERAAASGAGSGSRSEIGAIASRRALQDSLAQADAQVFGAEQGMRDQAWGRELGAAQHNTDVDRMNKGFEMEGATKGASLIDAIRNSAFDRGLKGNALNLSMQQQNWGQGIDALNQGTTMDQNDIANNFKNEALGMGQDQQSLQNQLQLMDWIRTGGNQQFAQDQAAKQGELGYLGLGQQTGQGYLDSLMQGNLANVGMQNSWQQQQQQLAMQQGGQQQGQMNSMLQMLMMGGGRSVAPAGGTQTLGQIRAANPYADLMGG